MTWLFTPYLHVLKLRRGSFINWLTVTEQVDDKIRVSSIRGFSDPTGPVLQNTQLPVGYVQEFLNAFKIPELI